MIHTVAIAGAGSRGFGAYARLMNEVPERVKVVAVADTNPERVRVAKTYLNLPDEMCFRSAEEILEQPKLADILCIATLDQDHVKQAIKAMKIGYDLLLEKPISSDLEECKEILDVATGLGRKVVVCHVLRYSPFYRKVKEIIDSGVLGELMSIQAIENVAYWHQAHSFVRGNWRNSDTTSAMIMQKCCHDMDLIVWLTGRKAVRVSSFGHLGHFTKEHAPEGATSYCMGGCRAKDTCPYDAEEFYLNHPAMGVNRGNADWPVNMVCLEPTPEKVLAALPTSQYGRCVYYCDNNVVDHQVVNVEMEAGLTVNFTMCAFTNECSRYSKYMGTKGSMIADMEKNVIEISRFGQPMEVITFDQMDKHGGGDEGLVHDFIDYMDGKECKGITELVDSVESHFICMAAEESRVNDGMVVEIEKFRRN